MHILTTWVGTAIKTRNCYGFQKDSPIFNWDLHAANFGLNSVLAAPQGEQVIRGDVHFHRQGPLTTISASDGSIIQYQNFDILSHEIVQFIQPGAEAQVLNRISGSENPSQILGTLLANGQVYLVNPAGIIFGQDAVVDVGTLYAAAGNISDEDYLNGLNHFSGLSGAVINRGVLNGEAIHLIGKNVANYGAITADGGVVTLMAGDEVYVGEDGSRIFVNLGSLEESETPGVENAGSIETEGGSTFLGAGDVYSLAIRHSGIVEATDITFEGGDGGIVEVSGTLDASDTNPGGTGGSVKVLGDKVGLLDHAVVDASGDTGGGEILIGGDYQGSNSNVGNASLTYVGSDVGIKADTITKGEGGKVIIWADDTTHFYGKITAKGGANSGNGGFVEVSGKETLSFSGNVDTSAPNGGVGTLLLDPSTLTIIDAVNTTGDHDNELTSVPNIGEIFAAVADAGSNTVSWGAIDSLAATTAIVLEATGLITIDDVTGSAGGTITSNNLVMLDLTTGSLTIRSTGGAITFMDTSDVIRTEGGAITLEAQGGTLTVGGLDTTGASGIPSGTVTLSSTDSVTAATINASTLSITAADTATFNGSLTAGGLKVDAAGVSFSGGNDVDTLTVNLSGASNGLTFVNLDDYTVGTVDGTSGITTNNGSISLTATTGNISLANDISSGGAAIDFNSAVDLTADVTITGGSGGITFASTINGTHNLILLSGTGDIELQDDAGGNPDGGSTLASLRAEGGSISISDVTTEGNQEYLFAQDGSLELSSDYTAINGDIFFNANDLTGTNPNRPSDEVPDVATIFKRTTGDVTIMANNFVMGQNEKLSVARGDLTIAVDGKAVIGDLNALGALTVTADKLTLLGRPEAPVLLAENDSVTDSGMGLVANSMTIDVDRNNIVIANNAMQERVLIETGEDDLNSTLTALNADSRFEVQKERQIAEGDFFRDGSVLDLVAEGTPNIDIAITRTDPTTDETIAGLIKIVGEQFISDGDESDMLDPTIPVMVENLVKDGIYIQEGSLGDVLQIAQQLIYQGEIEQAIEVLRRAVKVFDQILPDAPNAYGNDKRDLSFREAVAPIYFKLADLLLHRVDVLQSEQEAQTLLSEVQRIMELLKMAEIQNYYQDDSVNRIRAKTRNVKVGLYKTAVVNFIPLRDRTEIVLTLPTGKKRYKAAVGSRQLIEELQLFRRRLEMRTTRHYLYQAQSLYEWLIRPIESTLQSEAIDTLVFIPDGPLYTIPMAALHDGARFLIEKYAVAVAPALTLMEQGLLFPSDVRVLSIGLSKSVQGYPALPFVIDELDQIERLFGGKKLMNEDYRVPNLDREFKSKEYTIVHIAAHAEFNSDAKQTFVLTYDGKLTPDGLEEMLRLSQLRNEPVDLLVLSACRTAAEDDQAALGLGSIAVKSGARSAIGTLWQVHDEASALLMAEFYTQLDRMLILSKSKALQNAQKHILQNPRYRHPFYWSPYLLIGNWQ